MEVGLDRSIGSFFRVGRNSGSLIIDEDFLFQTSQEYEYRIKYRLVENTKNCERFSVDTLETYGECGRKPKKSFKTNRKPLEFINYFRRKGISIVMYGFTKKKVKDQISNEEF